MNKSKRVLRNGAKPANKRMPQGISEAAMAYIPNPGRRPTAAPLKSTRHKSNNANLLLATDSRVNIRVIDESNLRLARAAHRRALIGRCPEDVLQTDIEGGLHC